MIEKNIDFQFKARYYQLGEFSEKTKNLWLICHGHGQLAKFFIQKFKCLDDGTHAIVAPEGLSRYYLEGFSGRVGATWMTKEDRLTDIQNYLSYLNAVYQEISVRINPGAKVTLFGFSQGAATITRFATQSEIPFHRLILWGGIFPPNLDIPQSQKRLHHVKAYLVYGNQDPYLTETKLQEQVNITERLKTTPEMIRFGGGHALDEKVLVQFGQLPDHR